MPKQPRASKRTGSSTSRSSSPRHLGGTANPVPSPRRAGGPTNKTHTSTRQRVWTARQAQRRRRVTAGIVVVVVGAGTSLFLSLGSGPSSANANREVLPPPVAAGQADIQSAALVVANRSGIKGVVAYDTTGWPTTSHNGPADRALGHRHVAGPVRYSVTPPVGGDHNALWANCGVYAEPIPAERAVHDLEHGAVWITYRPSLAHAEVAALRAFVDRQRVIAGTGSRYVDLTPFPGMSSNIAISSWGFQLKVTSPDDPRLQRFVDTFRTSPRYTPEYGGECTGGVGTPIAS